MKKDPRFEITVCSSGQHREMLDQALETFQLKVDVNLGVMSEKQTLNGLTSRVISELNATLEKYKPNLTIVHGDTNTAFSAALASFYNGIPVAHVEAGLRTHVKTQPFPEEMNRQLLSTIASLHFAPTNLNRENLISEGVDPNSIKVTGNTVIDALNSIMARISHSAEFRDSLDRTLDEKLQFSWKSSKFIIVTSHRRENIGSGLEEICLALRSLAAEFPDTSYVIPVHPNPAVRDKFHSMLSGFSNVYLVSPLGYEQFLYLMSFAMFVVTDSGGLQEEAPSLGKPVVLLRDSTERPEALANGSMIKVPASSEAIFREVSNLIIAPGILESMSDRPNPFGDGFASERIVEEIAIFLSGMPQDSPPGNGFSGNEKNEESLG